MQLRALFQGVGPVVRDRQGAFRSVRGLVGAAGLLAVAALGLAGPAGAAGAGAELTVTVSGLRNAHGQVLACLANEAKAFPDCRNTASRHAKVAASAGEVTLDFGTVPPGTYAIALFHDENGNGRIDKLVMIPREGFGFSRDAPVRMGPPSFGAAAFAAGTRPEHLKVKLRYML